MRKDKNLFLFAHLVLRMIPCKSNNNYLPREGERIRLEKFQYIVNKVE